MKKNKVFLTSLLVLTSSLLVGCKTNDTSEKKGDKVIESITLSGLNDVYDIRQSVDFKNLSLDVNFSDKSKVTLNKYEVDLVDKSLAKEDTKFILYTDGLSTQTSGALTSKEYSITCDLIDYKLDTPYKLKDVKVVDDMSMVYSLTSFNEPSNIQEYKKRVDDALKNDETSFKEKPDYFTVGTDNEFIYKVDASLTDKTTAVPVSASLSILPKVYKLNDGEKGEEATSSEYSFNPLTSGFKFTSEAKDQKYRLEVLPKDYKKVSGESGEISPLILDIKVMDGYNAYTALDLGRINVVDIQNNPDFMKSVHDENTTRIFNGTQVKFLIDVNRGMYFDEETNSYKKDIARYQIWEDFLKKDKGLSDIKPIKGIYFQNNIKITKEDIPSQFFISEAESKAMSSDKSDFAKDTLRDFTFIYTHYLFDHDFNLNGNLFKLDSSEIKLGRSKLHGANVSFDVYSQNSANKEMGNSTLFDFCGSFDGESKNVANIKNLESIGNLGEVLSLDKNSSEYKAKIDDASGSLIFLRASTGLTKVDNLIVKYYQIGFHLEGRYSYKCIEVNNSRVYDCFTSGVSSYGSSGYTENLFAKGDTSNPHVSNINTISNSELKRFGGPAILLESLLSHLKKFDDPSKTFESIGAAGLKATNCVIESYVDGTEPWFSFNNASQYATNIVSMFNPLTQMYGKSIIKDVNGTNKMNMQMLGIDSSFFAAKDTTKVRYEFNNYAPFDTVDEYKLANLLETQNSDLRTDFGTFLSNGAPYIRFVNEDNTKDTIGYVVPNTGIHDKNTTLINPYYNPATKSLTGADKKDGDYVQLLIPMKAQNPQMALELAMVLQLNDWTFNG